jgi:YD repeat-containing protein
LDGLGVTNSYDNFLRRTNLSTVGVQTRYGYDNASRLRGVSDSTNSVTYSYVANSPLVGQISFTNNGALRMVTTKNHDFLNRLSSISSQPSAIGSSAVGYSYTYNNANQRGKCQSSLFKLFD